MWYEAVEIFINQTSLFLPPVFQNLRVGAVGCFTQGEDADRAGRLEAQGFSRESPQGSFHEVFKEKKKKKTSIFEESRLPF